MKPKPTKYQKQTLSMIVSSPKSKGKTKIYQRGGFRYWEKSIRRLNIFLDLAGKDALNSGKVINGQIDSNTRLNALIALKRLLEPYKDVTKEENRPLSDSQVEEMRHIIAGRLVE